MNIQQLRYVVAIANSGTFREAAEKMYVSQPSLSISIKDLETELGFQIFSRTSSGTFLTQKGMDFYEKAQNLKSNDVLREAGDYILGKLPFLIFLSIPFIAIIFWVTFYDKNSIIQTIWYSLTTSILSCLFV